MQRVLLDNQTWRIGVGLLGGVTVTQRVRGITTKVPKAAAQHLMATIDAFKAIGGRAEPGDEEFGELCEDFAEAVFGSPAIKQRVFGSSPAENASWHHQK